MTASKLGETVGVSESTVVRFATELGYDGYPKLQKAMQEMIRNKLTSVQRIEVTSNRIGNDNVLDSVLNQDIDKIRRTIEETSHEDFARAVDEICKAERIYIFGVRSTAAIANFLAYYFEMIFDNVRVITSGSQTETFEQIFRITDKDVMIGISFPVTVQCRLRQWTLPVQGCSRNCNHGQYGFSSCSECRFRAYCKKRYGVNCRLTRCTVKSYQCSYCCNCA